MKIFYVITGLGLGGAERQVVDLADRMVSLGHSVSIAYMTGPALVRPAFKNINIFGFESEKTLFGFLRALLKLSGLLKRIKPDVVHSHMVHANILSRLARLTCRMPRLVCTAHSTNEGGRLRMLAYRLTAPLADVSTNVSAEAVAAFVKQGATKSGEMIAVPNGIDTTRFVRLGAARNRLRDFEGVTDADKVFLAVGRLNVAKDYTNLLRAFTEVAKGNKSVRLWVVGDGELRDELKIEVDRLQLSRKVKFLGIQNNVEEWMCAADVFVLSSAWEGFGLVVAEAMACEKVVVATDAGGVREVLGDCGFLVPVRDSVALSNALKSAIQLPLEEACELGVRARKRVLENFSLDSAVSRWLKIYEL